MSTTNAGRLSSRSTTGAVSDARVSPLPQRRCRPSRRHDSAAMTSVANTGRRGHAVERVVDRDLPPHVVWECRRHRSAARPSALALLRAECRSGKTARGRSARRSRQRSTRTAAGPRVGPLWSSGSTMSPSERTSVKIRLDFPKIGVARRVRRQPRFRSVARDVIFAARTRAERGSVSTASRGVACAIDGGRFAAEAANQRGQQPPGNDEHAGRITGEPDHRLIAGKRDESRFSGA